MRKASFRKNAILTGIIIATCQAGIASSHQLNNSLTAANAVDHFLVTCSEEENDHLYVQIDDLKVIDNRQFNVLVVKDKVVSSITNSDGKSSSVIRVKGGMGIYKLYVSQTEGGEKAANYQLIFHCEDSDNFHLDTSVLTKIDQP